MAQHVVVPASGGNFESVIDTIIDAGLEVRRLPKDAHEWSESLISDYFSDADAFLGIFGQLPITRAVLEGAPKLRVGVSPIIGTETIDVAAATELGILIANCAVPENYDGVAEAIVMATAMLVKQVPAKWAEMRAGGWRPTYTGKMLSEITLGMVGFGKIGRATAERFSGFGTRLLAYDPYVKPDEVERYGVEYTSLETLLASSDVVSIMTTLTDETFHIIGEAELREMQPGSYVINTARGPCIDEKALIDALRSGHLAGAAIDTYEVEPPARDNPLRTMPNVIATGHDIGHSQLATDVLRRVALEQLQSGLAGEVPPYVANPTVIDAWKRRIA